MVNLKNIYLEEAEDLFKLMEQALLMLDRELASRAFPAGSPFDPAASSAEG